jgi:hypothetical protein
MRKVEREIRQAQRKAEKAARRAQEQARSAQERARAAHEKARQFHAKFEHRWGPPPDAGFGASAHTPRGRASGKGQSQSLQEEQLAVLKMLQEGKISTQEAETLLQALGG